MISPMAFIQIVGPRDQFSEVIDRIQTAGMVQIEEVPLSAGAGDTLLHRTQLTKEQVKQKQVYHDLVRVLDEDAIVHIPKSIASTFRSDPAFDEQYRHWLAQDEAAVPTAVRAFHAELRSFKRRERNINDDLRVLTGYEEVVNALTPLIKTELLPPDHEVLGVLFERKGRQALRLLEKQMADLTGGDCQMLHANMNKGRMAVLVYFHSKVSVRVRSFIAQAGLSEVRGPRYVRNQPLQEVLKRISQDLDTLKTQALALTEQKNRFFAEKGLQLMVLMSLCHDRLQRLEVFSKFAHTHYTFIMEGWVPAQRLGDLRGLVASDYPEVMIQVIKAHGAASGAPVELHNPPAIRPFETLLALLPLPKYGTIDPTWFMAIFFPPIFGLMLGDIGYGLLLAIGAYLLWRKGKTSPLAKSLGIILSSCAFFTVVFGFVFGELFGTLGHKIGLHPLWRERLEIGAADTGKVLMTYLIFSVAVGAAHILCGLVLGIINAHRSKQTNTVVDCTARIVGLFGLFFVVGRLVNLLPPAFTSVTVVTWLIFFVLMAWTTVRHPIHGLMMPLELLGTMGNILSYARIMAVGMASAVLALLANQFGSMINNIVLATIVVVLIHALNLVLGVVDPTIQGLRLHYVEFFSKFYVSGGRVYSPFEKMGGKSL